MADAEDERDAYDARMRAFAEGLVALQTAVTQVTQTVNEFATESNRRAARAEADATTARAEAAAAGAAPAATGTPARSDLVRALQEVAHPTPKEVDSQPPNSEQPRGGSLSSSAPVTGTGGLWSAYRPRPRLAFPQYTRPSAHLGCLILCGKEELPCLGNEQTP